MTLQEIRDWAAFHDCHPDLLRGSKRRQMTQILQTIDTRCMFARIMGKPDQTAEASASFLHGLFDEELQRCK
jgi:hypothetical protein